MPIQLAESILASVRSCRGVPTSNEVAHPVLILSQPKTRFLFSSLARYLQFGVLHPIVRSDFRHSDLMLLPEACEILQSLQIVLIFDPAFDAELRQDRHHLPKRESGKLSRTKSRTALDRSLRPSFVISVRNS